MQTYYVVIRGERKGPYPRAKIVAALQSGKLSEDAEIYDAATDDIVLAMDLLEPAQDPPQPAVNYGRSEDHKPLDQRSSDGSQYTQDAQQEDAAWNAPTGNPQQPYGPGYSPGERPSPPVMAYLAIVLALCCWPIGLLASLSAKKECKARGASTTAATVAFWLSMIAAIVTIIRLTLRAVASG